MAHPPQQFVFTYRDLQEITGLSKTGVSQHVSRGNLNANDLVSVCAFIARYGRPDVRMEIIEKMLGIDRQIEERTRPQSLSRNPKATQQAVAEESLKYKSAKRKKPVK
jgi:hypothetical protein